MRLYEQPSFQALTYGFVTGIAVVTTTAYGRPLGFAVNSFTVVSQEPALVSFVASQEALHTLTENSDVFCLNILAETQQAIGKVFSRPGGTRFQATQHHYTVSGIPKLAGTLVWLECSIANTYPAGENVIVLGNIHHVSSNTNISEVKPLISYQGQFGTFSAQ